MAIRFDLGAGSANGGSSRGALLYVGLALTAFGLSLAWLFHKGIEDLRAIGLVIAGSGVWIAGLHRLVRRRARGLAVMGGLFVGWGVVGGIAAAHSRFWIGALVCAVLLFVGLLLLGVVPLPAWAQRAVAPFRKIGVALVPMGAGLAIIAIGLGGGASEGVPTFVPVAAGLAFFFAGVGAVFYQSGGQDTVLTRIFSALLVTAFAAAAVVFPPSLLFMAPIAVLSWIAVVRLVVEKRTGTDPLAKWSDGQLLGLGCGVTVVIGILIIGLSVAALVPPEARGAAASRSRRQSHALTGLNPLDGRISEPRGRSGALKWTNPAHRRGLPGLVGSRSTDGPADAGPRQGL